MDETFDAKAHFVASNIKVVLGNRKGRLGNSSPSRNKKEYCPWHHVFSKNQTKSKKWVKYMNNLEGGKISP